jgi:hypothetical protein
LQKKSYQILPGCSGLYRSCSAGLLVGFCVGAPPLSSPTFRHPAQTEHTCVLLHTHTNNKDYQMWFYKSSQIVSSLASPHRKASSLGTLIGCYYIVVQQPCQVGNYICNCWIEMLARSLDHTIILVQFRSKYFLIQHCLWDRSRVILTGWPPLVRFTNIFSRRSRVKTINLVPQNA